MIIHIYDERLEKEIINTKYIPRKIKSNEKLKIHHKYWINEYNGTVKVSDIDYIAGTEYYTIKFDKNMSACFSYPVYFSEIYELLHNNENIENQDIINSKLSYSGAEIKFWFIVNKIDLSNPDYKGFIPFLIPSSKNVVSDNKYYFVKHDESKSQKFKIVLDREKSK